MKRFTYLFSFCLFVFSPLICHAQKSIKVSGEYVYHAPKSESPIQAERTAIQRARIQALADFFGTRMQDITVMTMHSDDGKSDISLQKEIESSVKGEWIADEKDPEVEFLGYENGMMVFKARVWGIARELPDKSFATDVRILRNMPDLRNESLEFTDGDDIFVYFQCPADGYLSVYLVDENQQANLIYPYRQLQENAASPVEGGREYYLFSRQMAAGNANLVDEYQIFTTESLAYNDFFILFSTQPFNTCLNRTAGDWNPEKSRSVPYAEFQQWLTESHAVNPRMKIVRIPILIRKK